MAPIVVGLDVTEINRVLERSIVPIQILHPSVNFGVVMSDASKVALEVTMVYRIKSNLSESVVNYRRDSKG